MAVSFLANSWQLANWGFSAGDIAALAGAGRGVITWLSASGRDKALLDFLKTSSSDLGIRRGLIDPISLNKRWSKRIVLFRDGERRVHEPAGKKAEIENIESLTWIMTIIVACLDVAVSNSVLQDVVVQLLLGVFENSTLDVEYLEHEIPSHILGWRSTACVRGMIAKAQHIWNTLEDQRRHLPGLAPAGEGEEIVQMLLWLMTGTSARYHTSSSDAFSLAVLLEDLGFDLLRTGNPGDFFSEAIIAIIFDNAVIPIIGDGFLPFRRRYMMRVPLKSPEESVSLWPGPSANNNYRRQIFINGMEIGADIHMVATCDSNGLEWSFRVSSLAYSKVGRGDLDAHRLAHKYTLLVTKEVLAGLLELINSWSTLDRKERGRVIRCLEQRTVLEHDMEYLADLQVFLLGYYYGVLIPHVDASQLPSQEVFGSWTWYDHDFLAGVARLVDRYRPPRQTDDYSSVGSSRIPRIEVMKLVAYLFAGAETDQLNGLGDSTQGSYGLNAKLVLLSASLLGNARTSERVGTFVLLDIDPTCIPADRGGVVKAGKQLSCVTSFAGPTNALKFLEMNEDLQDFTSHIQPAWGFDPHQCLLTFRHKGRLVHKVHPGQLEYTALNWMTSQIKGLHPDFVSAHEEATSETALEKALRTALLESTSQPAVEALFDAMPRSLRVSIGISHPTQIAGSYEMNSKSSSFPESKDLFQARLSEFYGSNLVLPGRAEAARGKVVFLPIAKLERAPLCILSMYRDHLRLVQFESLQRSKYDTEPTHHLFPLQLHRPPERHCGYFGTDWQHVFPRALVCLMEEQWVLLLI